MAKFNLSTVKKAAVAAAAAVAATASQAAPDVSEVVSDIDAAETPIAAVAGASLGASPPHRWLRKVRAFQILAFQSSPPHRWLRKNYH